MCFKALEEIIMAPIKLTQRVVSDIGDALGVNGGGGAEDTSAADAAAAEAAAAAAAAKAAADAEAARLAKIEQDRKAADERALATEAEKKRQTEMAATIKAENDAAAIVIAEKAAAAAATAAATGATVIATPETPLPSTVGSTTPTGNEETAIPTIATKDITSPSTTKKLSESLLQRLSKRGGTGRRSLISGSSGGLGFYSRFS
tara:strand:+ start:97 stop:708 length:612 start_codon:yes stop_codon:yes gene_type:complete